MIRTHRSVLLLLCALVTAGLSNPSSAQAASFSYTKIDPSLCATAPLGFTAAWLGGSTGCPGGSVCVKSSTVAGDPPNIPKCMPVSAANAVNFTDSPSCVASCGGQSCTQNQNNRIDTYYCSASVATLNTTNQPLPTQQGPANTILSTQPGPSNINNAPEVTLMNPLGTGATLNDLLVGILSIITDVIGPIIVILMLVYVGFKFVIAQGNESKLTEAKGMLLWTIVGALILLGAKVIAMTVLATVNALK